MTKSLFGWLRGRSSAKNPAELFETALSAHQAGELEAAERTYAALLEHAPEHLDALCNLAALYGQQGRWPDARQLLERANAVDPTHAGVLTNLGNLCQVEGQPEAAEGFYRNALAQAPEHLDALRAVGLMLLESGRAPDALPFLETAARIAPEAAQCHYDVGVALSAMGDLEGSVASYRKSIALDSDHFPAHVNLGNALRQLEQTEEALTVARRAVALVPDNAIALNSLAGALAANGEPDTGLTYSKQSLSIDPDNPFALETCGSLLATLGRFEEAETALTRALTIAPDAHGARSTLALVQLTRGDFEQGDFKQGWSNYEAGLTAGTRPHQPQGYPRWTGKPISGQSLLIVPEQGVGDELMFASCIPDAMRMARVERCVYACDPRLKSLLERSIPGLEVPPGSRQANTSSSEDPVAARIAAYDAFDYEIPVGSLPALVRTSADAFSDGDAFVTCDPALVQIHRSRLQALGDGFKVGISWRGGHDVRTRTARTIPLADWVDVLSTKGAKFINLQYGPSTEERAAIAETLGVTVHAFDEPDPLTDLDGFAALIKALDLVISIDNSTVHVAGSVGTPTWVMLPAVPDWRWHLTREDSLWYSSARLFRQPDDAPGNWTSVLNRVASELRQRVEGGSN